MISKFFPGLSVKLVQAGIFEKPEDFIKKSFLISSVMTPVIILILTIIFIRMQIVKWVLILAFPMLFFLLFLNFMRRPDVLIKKKEREFDREIVFAGRFLVIELQSGVPIYNAMLSVSNSYKIIGKYFKEILNRVQIGTSMSDAINEAIEITPSQNFRKLLWQVFNSLKTGADLATALSSTLDQISTEQVITAKEYGRKLNPLVMFYMVVAVIFPSIGIIMLLVFSMFFGLKVSLGLLLIIAFFVAFTQFIFLTIIQQQRPSVGL